MKKKTITSMLVVTFLAMSLIGCSKKGEDLITKDTIIETKVVEEVTPVKPTKVHAPKPTVEEPEVTPEPTPAEVVEIKPEPEGIVEAPVEEPEITEEEMITGKYNKFNEVMSEYNWTAEYFNYDYVFHGNDVSTITINEDGLKSSGSYKGYVTDSEWKSSFEYESTFKYGETEWKYTESTGDSWEEECVELTKEIAKFGFDFDRFEVKESKTSKDTITIIGTYTVSKTANTVYEMILLEVLGGHEVVGDVNKVTADVIITLDADTKSMKKVVLDYNMNGEVFGVLSDEGELDSFIDLYTHTLTFK